MRARGLRVDDQLELGGLLDRKVGRLGALENAADIDALLPVHVHNIAPVAHQSADFADVARAGRHRQRMARRPIRELEAPAIEKCILPDEDGVGPLAGEFRESRIDFAAGARIDDLRLKS